MRITHLLLEQSGGLPEKKKTVKGSFSSYEGDSSENSHIKRSSRFFICFSKFAAII